MLRRYDGYTTGVLETANQIYFTFGLAFSISIYALSDNFGFFGQLWGLKGPRSAFSLPWRPFSVLFMVLRGCWFLLWVFCPSDLLGYHKCKILVLLPPVSGLTAISLFLSSLRPFTFFGGFSPRKALVLDLGPVLGHSFFLCIYSSHHLSGCCKKIPPCYTVYDALTRYWPNTHDSLLHSPILPVSNALHPYCDIAARSALSFKSNRNKKGTVDDGLWKLFMSKYNDRRSVQMMWFARALSLVEIFWVL